MRPQLICFLAIGIASITLIAFDAVTNQSLNFIMLLIFIMTLFGIYYEAKDEKPKKIRKQ